MGAEQTDMWPLVLAVLVAAVVIAPSARPSQPRRVDRRDEIVEAWLLPAVSGPEWALFAFLRTSAGPPQVIRLDGDSASRVQNHGIALVDPGRYETACGKGYWNCTADEPPVLELKLPAVEFFVFESASSIFWWDRSAGAFKRTWTSD